MRNTSEASRRAGPIPAVGPSSDEALLTAFLGGDDEAFRTLFFRYRDELTALAHNLTGDFRVGEELVRRTMVRVFSTKRPFDAKLPLRLRLLRGVIRACRRLARRNAVMGIVGLRWRVRSRRILPVHLATQDAATDRHRARTVEALAKLKRPLREVVAVCDLAGLTYEEAAVVLGFTTRAIGIRLGRGRLRFAAAFQRAKHAAGDSPRAR